MAGARENIEHLADPVWRGIGQVETFSVEVLLVREIVERVGDEIDGHDVDAPAFDADHRHPRRQRLPQFLQRLEKVVWTVDLVDVAGLRIANDEARPVNPQRPRAVVAHHAFGIVLRPEVRMIEVFGLLEHVLAKDTVVEAGGRDRAHMVEAAHGDRFSELDSVARAFDIGLLLRFRACREIVDRGEMKEVGDLALELLPVVIRHAEARFSEVADNPDHLLVGGAPVAVAQFSEFLDRSLAHEDIDGLAAL